MPDLAAGLVYYVVFLFSTTVHEAAHAVVALLGDDPTAYHGGQVSLDPRPHIRREPFGMVIMPILSVLVSGWPLGFASAPYDRHWAVNHPKRAAWMALAGPGSNLLLVAISIALIKAGSAAGVFGHPASVSFGRVTVSESPGLWPAAAVLVSAFFSMNLVLATLNVLPFPPLDGSGAVPLLLDAGRTARYQHFLWSRPWIGFIGILAAWQLFRYVYHPVFLFAVNLLYPGVRYG